MKYLILLAFIISFSCGPVHQEGFSESDTMECVVQSIFPLAYPCDTLTCQYVSRVQCQEGNVLVLLGNYKPLERINYQIVYRGGSFLRYKVISITQVE